MDVFNCVYQMRPINKMAAKSMSSGIRHGSNVSARKLKKILNRRAKESQTSLDVEFERKCVEVAAKRKKDIRAMAVARDRAQKGRKLGKRGIFGKVHW